MVYSEVGTPFCSLNTSFTCTTVIIMEIGKTGLMKYPLYLKTVIYFAELYLFEKYTELKTYIMSTQQVPKLLKQNKNEIAYQICYLIKGG